MFVALALMVAPVVRADLGVRGDDVAKATTDILLSLSRSTPLGVDASVGSASTSRTSELQEKLAAVGVGELPSIAFDGLDIPAPEVAVIELPPAPSSAGLFLSAMLSVGAWQLVCSSRDLNLSALPDWYHTGGPVQIGHATPFDLNFNALALCTFTQPETERTLAYVPRRDDRTRPIDQLHSCSADPRGPPAQTV